MMGIARMNDFEIIKVVAPAYWASAIINDDFTGIDSEAECERVEAFIDSLPGNVVDCDDLGFMLSYGTDTPSELAGDYCEYSVVVNKKDCNNE